MNTDNKLQKYQPNEVPTAAPASWAQVKYYANIAAKFAQASLAAQVMAGFALAELRKEFSKSGARTDLTSPHDAARLAQISGEESSANLGWQDMVVKMAGISDDTARRWIAMAEGIKSRWKKLAPQARLRELMRVPVSDWQEEDTKLVSDAVAKVTDGATQLEFLRELGLAKKRQGAGAVGRLPGCENSGKKLSLSEEIELRRDQARLDWQAVTKLHVSYRDKFVLLPDAEVSAQIAVLEQDLRARKEWLKNPANKRDAKAIAEMFNTK